MLSVKRKPYRFILKLRNRQNFQFHLHHFGNLKSLELYFISKITAHYYFRHNTCKLPNRKYDTTLITSLYEKSPVWQQTGDFVFNAFYEAKIFVNLFIGFRYISPMGCEKHSDCYRYSKNWREYNFSLWCSNLPGSVIAWGVNYFMLLLLIINPFLFAPTLKGAKMNLKFQQRCFCPICCFSFWSLLFF